MYRHRNQLNSSLLNEMPQYKKQALSFRKDERNQFYLFRSLVNVRPPMPASVQFLKMQDEYLQAELFSKGITDIESLTAITEDLYLWQGHRQDRQKSRQPLIYQVSM